MWKKKLGVCRKKKAKEFENQIFRAKVEYNCSFCM